MVPTNLVAMDAFPITSNGKVDRAALPCPEPVVRPADRGRTPVERAVGTILAELLELGAIGRNDNFFELGGHSLMAAQFVARLEEQFDVDVELLAVFDNPTAAGIASVLEHKLAASRVAAN
jgi:acyl carrier protein